MLRVLADVFLHNVIRAALLHTLATRDSRDITCRLASVASGGISGRVSDKSSVESHLRCSLCQYPSIRWRLSVGRLGRVKQ
jgi:hypothetical protein